MRATCGEVGPGRSIRRYGCAPADITNLLGSVYVWAPFSSTEFKQPPRAKYVLKRCYRCIAVIGSNGAKDSNVVGRRHFAAQECAGEVFGPYP